MMRIWCVRTHQNFYLLLWQNEFNLNMSPNFSTTEWNPYSMWVFVNGLSDYGYMSPASVQCRVSCSPLLQWSMVTLFISHDFISLGDLDYSVAFAGKIYKAYIRLTTIMKEEIKCVPQHRHSIWKHFRWVLMLYVKLCCKK